MDTKPFLTEFSHIASAPRGVQRLRELVVYLATHGQLLPDSTSDPSAAQLIIKIADRNKQVMIERGDSRRESALPPLEPGDGEGYPLNWAVTRLGRLIHLVSGQHLSAEEQNSTGQGIPYLTGASDFGSRFPIVSRWTSVMRAVAVRDDILLTVKGTIGKVNVLNLQRAALGRQLMAVRSLAMDAGFLELILRSREQHFLAKSVGIAIPGISRDDVRHLVVGVPPLKEQQRIISKVDELMALCDKLEAQERRREKLSATTYRAAFRAMSTANAAPELTFAWRRFVRSAPILLDSPEGIRRCRGAILDLAMSGALLPPNARSGLSGRELLGEIDERRRLWAISAEGQELKEAIGMAKKVRTQRRFQLDSPIPEHWAWASILQISQAVVDCHNKTAPYASSGIHLVRTTDIRNGRMDLKNTRKITADTYAFWSRRLPPRAGDLILTREAPMGEAAVVPEGEQICLGQRTMLIRLFPDLFNNKFLLYAIYGPSFQARMLESAVGMTVKHLRVGDVEDLLVPVPPKEEQDRIVTIVERLFATCDRLEDALVRKPKVAGDFARAVTEAITGLRIGDVEAMRAPKTELVSALRTGLTPSSQEEAPLSKILARAKGEMSAKALWNSSGLKIDAFYQQLKTEMSRGWIVQPEPAYVKEVEAS